MYLSKISRVGLFLMILGSTGVGRGHWLLTIVSVTTMLIGLGILLMDD